MRGQLGTDLSESVLSRFALPWSVERLTRPVCSQIFEMLSLHSQVKPKPLKPSLPSISFFSKSTPLLGPENLQARDEEQRGGDREGELVEEVQGHWGNISFLWECFG